MIAQIPEIYQNILNDDYLYFVFYGGRGGGKTENIAQMLVLMAVSKKLRILCIRENQNSLAESVKATIEKWIDKLELWAEFEITQSSIRCANGSEFLFMGMRNSNAVNVKSINDINITWIEEAEAFSKRSWELLVPSVIRTQNPKIIITFNPHKEDDIIYKEFISGIPPSKSFIQKVNYSDNPFFEGSVLEAQMLDDMKRLPSWEFNHRWKGELAKYTEDSLFSSANLEPLDKVFEKERYIKIITACDPATTDKHYSNEYGIIVLGKTAEGIIEVIDDLSGNKTPLDFALTCVKTKELYNIDEVVVEVNNGGDFIKATLLQIDPTLNIVEVRANRDKVQRALPVANLMSINKVRLLQNLNKLTRQMRLLTQKGFMGNTGESPDRLDAFVWGVYHLANIRDKDSIYSVFNPDEFNTDKEYLNVAYVALENILYSALIEDTFYCIEFNVLKNIDDYRLFITKSYAKDFNAYAELINTRKGLKNILRDNGASRTYQNNLEVEIYEGVKEKEIDKKVLNILPFIKQSKVYLDKDMPSENYNNTKGQLLILDLMEYKYNTDIKYPFLEVLCDIIYNEYGINKER